MEQPVINTSALLAFMEAVDGRRGELDAWLEVNDEESVRAHVRGLIESRNDMVAKELIAALSEIEASSTDQHAVGIAKAALAKVEE